MTDKKMQVIGIYGTNAAGKSTLSHILSRDFLDFDTIATDNLLAIKRMNNKDNPIWNHSSYSQWERLGEPTPHHLWQGFLEYRDNMQDYLACMLDRAHTQKVGMIIEGIHIDPRYFQAFNDNLDIRLFFLHVENSGKHKERIVQKCDYRPTLLERLERYFPRIRELQEMLLNEARDHAIPIIETGNSINDAMQAMRNGLR